MTSCSESLSNIRTYKRSSYIQIANVSQLHIHVVRDINSSIKDVLVSPALSTNLIYVGQLVDNDCGLQFSRDGSIVQDQVLGKIHAKGPKIVRLFPLYFSIPPIISMACNKVIRKGEIWHKHLGHLNHCFISFNKLWFVGQ